MIQLDDQRFNRLAVAGVLLAFLLLLAALAAMLFSFRANVDATQWVRHSYQVTDQLAQLDLQLERAESGRRGFLIAPNRYRAEVYLENAALVPGTLTKIDAFVRDNGEQVPRARKLRMIALSELQELKTSMTLAQAGHVAEAQAQFVSASSSATAIRAIRNLTAQMRNSELRLLASRIEATQRTQFIIRTVLAITGAFLFLIGAAAFLLVRRYTVELTSARDRLHLLNTDLEGAVAERTADLQRANEEIQRFAYIVSHDLRSPLVNILGFTAELEETNKSLGKLIERAHSEAPHIITDDTREAQAELPEAIGFIRSSTQKMDRLINAILKLSREGRRNLTPEHLPMALVLRDIAASLEHRALEAEAKMVIDEPMPDLVSDRVAIEQIFSNLIENAVKYLQPGRPGRITVRGRPQGSRVIYEVEDNGRGIDPKDHQRIFDLFRRSGTQDRPGEGIGLAHARALAYRLGGTINVTSALGEGTTFSLNLPATYSEGGTDN